MRRTQYCRRTLPSHRRRSWGPTTSSFWKIWSGLTRPARRLVHRLPEQGSGEIKFGAQLTVRESQAAVFFYQGKAVEAFGPGRHTLKTANIPILTKIASIPWAMKSPLRAEVYFVNLKVFTNLKWGTRDPVAFKDCELGLIRLRAFGVFNLQVVQPVLFINSLVGTQGMLHHRGGRGVPEPRHRLPVQRLHGADHRLHPEPARPVRRTLRGSEQAPGGGFQPLRAWPAPISTSTPSRRRPRCSRPSTTAAAWASSRT